MAAKPRVQKRLYYKIGEACKTLGIQPYVLRYWETEFPALAPSKSRSGQRVYSEREMEIIRRIKELLYEEGYTIAGAKKKLEGELASGILAEEREDGAEGMMEGAMAAGAAEAVADGTAEAEAATEPPPPPPPPRRTARQQPPPPVVSPVAPTSVFESSEVSAKEVSTNAAQIEQLRAGIARALQEAREILALLDANAS